MIPDKLMDKILDKNIPLSVSFELTWRCNLRCVHCYQYSPCDNELTTDEVKDILDQLARAGSFYLSLTGGEPLMRKDFLQIAEYVRKKTFSIILQTNGTLITPSMAKRIKDLNFTQVHISLLGAKATTHDQITRVEGSFQEAIKAAELLKEKGVSVILKTTFMKQNVAEYREIKELSDRLGMKLGTSPIIYPKNDMGQDPIQYRVSDKDIKEIYSYFSEEDPHTYKNAYKNLRKKESSLLCGFGRVACGINPKGEVYPCVGLPIVVGNLRKKRFAQIWEEAEVLNDIRKTKDSDLKRCFRCGSSSICFRCSALAWFEKGDLWEVPEECCRVTNSVKEVIVK